MRGCILGIEIDGASINLMEVRKGLGGKRITKYSILEVPKQSIVDGMICDEEMIYQRLANELKIKKYSAKKVIYIIHSSLLVERQISMEVYKNKTIKRLLEIRADDFLPIKGNEYEIDFSVLGETKEEGRKKNKVLIVAMPKRIIMPLMKLSSRLKLMPAAVTVPTQTLVVFDKQGDDSILFIDIKDEKTALTIIHKGKEYVNKVVEYGMNAVKDSNERIPSNEFVSKIQPGVECFLVPEIENILEAFYREYGKRTIDRVYLIGEGADNSRFQEYIGNVLNKPVGNIGVLYKRCGIKQYSLKDKQYLLVHLAGVMQGI